MVVFFVLIFFKDIEGYGKIFGIVVEDCKILGIIVGIVSGYGALRLGKGLLFKQQSKFLSLNKESLIIYNTVVPTLLSNKNPCAIIPWGEILDVEIEKMIRQEKHSYIVLVCNLSIIQSVPKQLPEKIFMTHFIDIRDNCLFLRTETWLDVPFKDIFNLIQEFHKEATAKLQ